MVCIEWRFVLLWLRVMFQYGHVPIWSCSNMVSQRDLYNECQDMVSTILSLSCGRVKFNKLFCKVLANDYLTRFKYFNKWVFSEGDFIDLPGYKQLWWNWGWIVLCGQILLDTWTQKFWWVSVITSSDSASVVLHLREFIACVNVLVQTKINMIYGPPLVSVDSSVEESLEVTLTAQFLAWKEYSRGILFTSNFAELGKHLSKNWRQKLPTMDIHTW